MGEFRLQTERLILRDWEERDQEAFAAMCADPRVMATLGPVMDKDATAALLDRVKAIAETHGHSFWALERRADGAFLGWCGLIRGLDGPIEGKAEIGWRLAFDGWGQGYAREAAEATLNWGFRHLADDAIWAITAASNHRSWGLMERLGMVRHPDLDFDHPRVAHGSPLKRHVTYSIGRP
jgi:RimJ/RimL family protein N-acetyltransferase